MPTLLILANGAKFIVGDTVAHKGFLWSRRVIAEDLQDGKACTYRARDVMFTKEIPQSEWSANIERERKEEKK